MKSKHRPAASPPDGVAHMDTDAPSSRATKKEADAQFDPLNEPGPSHRSQYDVGDDERSKNKRKCEDTDPVVAEKKAPRAVSKTRRMILDMAKAARDDCGALPPSSTIPGASKFSRRGLYRHVKDLIKRRIRSDEDDYDDEEEEEDDDPHDIVHLETREAVRPLTGYAPIIYRRDEEEEDDESRSEPTEPMYAHDDDDDDDMGQEEDKDGTERMRYAPVVEPKAPYPLTEIPQPMPVVLDEPSGTGGPAGTYKERLLAERRQQEQNLPKYVRKELLDELERVTRTEDMVLDGTHPKLIAMRAEVSRLQEEADRRIKNTRDMEMRRVEERYKKNKSALDSEVRQRKEEIEEFMQEEIDERLRNLVSDIASMDFTNAFVDTTNTPMYVPPTAGKKSLRSARGSRPDQPYYDGKPLLKKKTVQPPSYMLSESSIARDLRRLGVEETGSGRVVNRRVALDSTKLLYEGKSYTRGQTIFIQTAQYPWFTVNIAGCCDAWIQFRSTIPGDTRCVTATLEDLECGRVLVSKKT